MAAFNSSLNVINSCVKSTEAVPSTTAFFVPSSSSLLGLNTSSFATTAAAIENHSYIGIQQKNIPSITHHHVNSSSSITFMEIKREPCQVSEVTTSNKLYTNHNSKSLPTSTMTTFVKIESTSPKMDMDRTVSQIDTNHSIPVSVAVARKRPQEIPPVQPSRDINYFGIRVADIGGVAAAGCGNIYFSGADLIPGANTEDLNSIHNASRSSTFWPYPNAFPLESVISMSPVGIQYARDPNRGQFVLLPTASTMETFPQAAFLWPQYMQPNPGAPQTTSNFVFPSVNPQNSAPTQSYAAPLQLLGPNYLTATGASSTVCHHSQSNVSRYSSSDRRRTEKSQKQSVIQKNDWFQNSNLHKDNFTTNFDATSKAEKSKDDESSYSESISNFIGPMPLMPNEQSNMLLNNTHSPSELSDLIPPNYTIAPNMTLINTPQMEEPGVIYKNSALKFSKRTEMQDVNIQTDTPVCSDDENSVQDVSSAELISCNLQSSEKVKSLSNQCHSNYSGGKAAFPKESSIDLLQQYTAVYDFSKPNAPITIPEVCDYENECVSSISANKNESYSIDRTTILPSSEGTNESSTFKANINPPPLLEMSGLELLSNISTGSFVNHDALKTVRVKQEPCENVANERKNESFANYESYDTNCSNLEMQCADNKEKHDFPDFIKNSTSRGEKTLGGLNLLCALAEQRIQEEVESNNFSNNAKDPEVKKRKHKHSKSKSIRQSRYYKESKKKLSNERKGSGLKSECDDAHNNFRRAFEKVGPNYKKINKWPDAEDFFKAMESDMRMRLADITRQYKKKKRKLEEISKTKKRKMTSEYKFANISCKNPSFICFLDKFQSTPSNFLPSTDVTEIKSLNIQNKNMTNCAVETSQDNKESSTSLGELTSSIKINTQNLSENTILSKKKRSKNKINKKTHISTLKIDRITLESRSFTTKNESKQNKITTEKNVSTKKIDKEIVLSNEHLYREETRVLTDMGGLFYAGILKPLQPPDVYAITLDGERGNKSHIMSREEIFKDTILEVAPTKIENVPTGTRLCAYWSQQYRCLYPGKAIDSDNTDVGSDFVSVEFDDGDSGRIRLQNIRYLLSDYPIVEYNDNFFNNLGKSKKSSSIKTKSSNVTSKESNKIIMGESEETDHISFNQKKNKNKKHTDEIKSHLSTLTEFVHKHTKHRKKKKHKKYHRKTSPKNSITNINEDFKEDTNLYQDTETQSFKYNELQSNAYATNIKKSEVTETTDFKTNTELLVDNVKHEINGLDDEDSTSNVVSETSEEAKNERVDYNSGKGSKIAAFLPERQLWGWLGQAYRKAGMKGRARKQFYKSITRGKETITVGECAVFLSTGRPDRPYIGRIEAMWETKSSNKIVRVRWFYHPEETTGCPALKYPGALFDSPHEDENDVQTISHRCEVVEFSVYIAKFGSDSKQYQSIYDNNDTYYLSGYYNPRLQVLKMQPDIPTLDESSL